MPPPPTIYLNMRCHVDKEPNWKITVTYEYFLLLKMYENIFFYICIVSEKNWAWNLAVIQLTETSPEDLCNFKHFVSENCYSFKPETFFGYEDILLYTERVNLLLQIMGSGGDGNERFDRYNELYLNHIMHLILSRSKMNKWYRDKLTDKRKGAWIGK